MRASMLSSTGRPPETPWTSPPGSATATRSTPGRLARTRAWWRPIIPRPMRPARRVAMSGTGLREGVDGLDDALEVTLGEGGVHRQREALAGGALGLGQVDVGLERRQAVVGHRVE